MHVDVGGTRLWFDVEGPALVPEGSAMRARPTVVLLHGGPGSFDHSYLKPDFARLAEVAQVVWLDLPGHGRSDHGDPAAWSWEGTADAVRAFCDAVGIERPVVLGHSLGAFVAATYAARHAGHARSLVLTGACARFDLDRVVDEFRRRGGDEIAAVVRRSYGGEGEPVTAEEWAPCWRLFGPRVVDDAERARTVVNPELNALFVPTLRAFDVVGRLGAVTSPTLVVAGDLDPITPLSAARELVDALPPALGRLEVLDGAGHFPWKDVPERFWPLVTDFVAAVA